MGIEPDAGEPTDAPASPKPELRGAGGKAKQKAHNQPPVQAADQEGAEEQAPAKLKAFQAYVIVQTAKLAKQRHLRVSGDRKEFAVALVRTTRQEREVRR